jgi:imidazolonepropionase
MIADLVIRHIGELVTPCSEPPVKGRFLSAVHRFPEAFIAVKAGLIIGFGGGDFSRFVGKKTVLYDASGCLALPGFIDAHTHLVFAGSREHEFADKVAGVPYLDILKRGGGIFSTVEKTRKATFAELEAQAAKSLRTMLSYGVTTIEAKSGYGLDEETEIRQLEVAASLAKKQPVEILSTYMGAHAIPLEYALDREGYLLKLIEMMKLVKSRHLAIFTDVFCEDGVFTPEESRRLLEAGRNIGLIPKIHADEIVSLGGAGIAVRVHASSADHLMAVNDEGIAALAASDTIANLLPGTSFFLNKDYADARKMIDAGVAVAVASDYNPGTAPSENFQLVMELAAGKLRMTPEEILNAVTINPAYELGIAVRTGSIALGKQADIVLLNAPNLEYILYHYGINHTQSVFKKGVLVVENGRTLSGGES